MKLTSASLAKIAGIGTIVFAFAIVIIGSISVSMSNSNRVVMGVQTSDTTLAGMSKKEVKDYFAKKSQEKLKNKAAVLDYKKQQFVITPADINLQAEIDKAADDAYNIGREHSFFINLLIQLKCALFGQQVNMTATYDDNLLEQKLNAIKKQVDTPPVNAEVKLAGNGTITKKAAVTGLTLDTAAIKDQLDAKLKSLRLTIKLNLAPEEQAPYVTDADIADIDSILGSYTTNFAPGDRGDNIGIAASHLQGVLIKSQASLSFNQTVGKRTRAAGYKNAGVIVDGEPAIDVGGGVCQVSSTLYNAILLAGLKPTERCNHSLPSHYVPAGRDATVADNLLDFVFQNPLPHPVMLRVSNTGSSLTIYVLGTKNDLGGKTISLTSEGNAKEPSVYRIWRLNGQIIEREFLHTDKYS